MRLLSAHCPGCWQYSPDVKTLPTGGVLACSDNGNYPADVRHATRRRVKIGPDDHPRSGVITRCPIHRLSKSRTETDAAKGDLPLRAGRRSARRPGCADPRREDASRPDQRVLASGPLEPHGADPRLNRVSDRLWLRRKRSDSETSWSMKPSSL